ncbi:MAG: hypothetical protein GY811_06840 [Myxococcales bacterium]|nr:hypothetical protein [Myxococcales bacterium]
MSAALRSALIRPASAARRTSFAAGEQEACLQESCVPLGEGCDFTEECEIGEICEPTLGRCIPRDAVAVSEFVPPVGVLEP